MSTQTAGPDRNFWLALFSFVTWNEFLNGGASVAGFREKHFKTLQRIRKSDVFLCYMIGASRWIASLEVTGSTYFDSENKIWSAESFPARVPVRVLLALEPEYAVPISEIRDRLPMFARVRRPTAWSGLIRFAPRQINREDAHAILSALEEARATPAARPISKAQKGHRPSDI